MAFVTEDNLTDLAVKRWATTHSPRLAEVMTALVRHLHAFARDVDLTEEEWAAAVEWLTATGRINDDKRQESILASDALGLSTLVVQLNHRLSAGATPATVLGPFHIDDSPEAAFGADMSDDIPGTPCSSPAGSSTSTAHRCRTSSSTCLLARTAGLIGRLAEEIRIPVANDIFLSVDRGNRAVPPHPADGGEASASG